MRKTQYNDVPFVPSCDCASWDDCRSEAYKEGYADAIEEFVTFCVNDWKMTQACVIANEPTDVFRIGGYLSRLLEQFKDEYAKQLKEQTNEMC